MVKTGRLLQIAAITGIVCSASGLYFQGKIRQNLKSGEYYAKAMKLLRSHRPSIEMLGEPIKDGKIDLGDNENIVGLQTAQLKVPIRGPKDKGKLYIFAEKDPSTNSWEVRRLEMSFNSIADRRLVVHKTGT